MATTKMTKREERKKKITQAICLALAALMGMSIILGAVLSQVW